MLLRLALILLALAIIAGAGQGHTAGNSLPGSPAGEGVGSISGYTVTGVSFSLDPAALDRLEEVSFSLAPVSAGDVGIQLALGGPWYSCSNLGGSVSCPISPPSPLTAATDLRVVAVSD